MHFQIEEREHQYRITANLNASQPTLAQPRPKKIHELLPEFFEALLDSQLRVEIQEQTAAVRELIIAKAFAESGVLEDPPPGTFEDPVSSGHLAKSDLVQISNKGEQES
jgi:His-Xaa-Ser system protein HxsD